jgi:hypothetical protein
MSPSRRDLSWRGLPSVSGSPDPSPILELFARRFGLGKVGEQPAYENPNPSATWRICATADFLPAVELFEAAELRGRKRREFEVWREAALERAFARIGGRRWERGRVAAVATRLKELRVYRAPRDAPEATSVAVQRKRRARVIPDRPARLRR